MNTNSQQCIFTQSADGLPVYGSRLMVLVRNADGFPAVSATTELKNVKGYKNPRKTNKQTMQLH